MAPTLLHSYRGGGGRCTIASLCPIPSLPTFVALKTVPLCAAAVLPCLSLCAITVLCLFVPSCACHAELLPVLPTSQHFLLLLAFGGTCLWRHVLTALLQWAGAVVQFCVTMDFHSLLCISHGHEHLCCIHSNHSVYSTMSEYTRPHHGACLSVLLPCSFYPTTTHTSFWEDRASDGSGGDGGQPGSACGCILWCCAPASPHHYLPPPTVEEGACSPLY